MSAHVRIETLALDGAYVAVLRTPGLVDEILDDRDGKPLRFPTAGEARRAAEMVVRDRTQEPEPSPSPDPLGVDGWRRDRDRALREERARVFGAEDRPSLQINGREIVVERRRRS